MKQYVYLSGSANLKLMKINKVGIADRTSNWWSRKCWNADTEDEEVSTWCMFT
jgi:hypothetical protein